MGARYRMTKAKQLVSIIDDDEFIQRLLVDALELEGFRAVYASSAEDCYRLLGNELPDVFVMDILLPGQNGLQLCQNLRKHPLTKTIPILMLSSKSKVKDRITGLEAGADDYLVKPFHLDELIARVKVLLRRNSERVGDKDIKTDTIPPFPVPKKTESVIDKSTPKTTSTCSPVKSPSKSELGTIRETKLGIASGKADFDSRKKHATELYQKRLYDKAYHIFETLNTENPKDQYVKKYIEVTKTSLMKHYLTVLGSKDAVPERTSDRPEDFIGLDFNTQEGFIFSRVDGVTDFKGIVAISGMKPLTAYGVLYNLMQSGVIKTKTRIERSS
jgi:DNA-binding response OmpR family regulator